MEQSFFQKLILRSVSHRVHKSSPPSLILNRTNLVSTLQPNNPKTTFPPIYSYVFQVISLLNIFKPKFVPISHPPHTCYIPRPSNLPCFDHPNIIWLTVQIMELVIYLNNSRMFVVYFRLIHGFTIIDSSLQYYFRKDDLKSCWCGKFVNLTVPLKFDACNE